MLGWWRRRRQERREIEAEARTLVERLGGSARQEATEQMVHTARAGEFDANVRWTRIRLAIDRSAGDRPTGASWDKAPPGVFGI